MYERRYITQRLTAKVQEIKVEGGGGKGSEKQCRLAQIILTRENVSLSL